MNYECDPRFDTYYLEDSYVLGLDESDRSRLVLSLLVVLTSKHPLYLAPPPTEQHCYRKGMLIFDGVCEVNWISRHFKVIADPDGTVDYGNVDSFSIESEGRYQLKGEWGQVALTAKSASIVLS